MPGTEELLSRLQRLEDGYYSDKAAAREKQFFDTYGGRFSNNRGIGLAILNELDAQGIDTSAADEAVQQILDKLRIECNEIIEAIKDNQQAAIENARKIEAIQNVVSEAVASNPDSLGAAAEAMPVVGGEMQAPEDEMVDGAAEGVEAVDNGEVPLESEETPAEEPAMEEQVTEEEPIEQESLPPEEVESDSRVKNIKGVLSDIRAKRVKKSMFKPSSAMLSAAMGGMQ